MRATCKQTIIFNTFFNDSCVKFVSNIFFWYLCFVFLLFSVWQIDGRVRAENEKNCKWLISVHVHIYQPYWTKSTQSVWNLIFKWFNYSELFVTFNFDRFSTHKIQNFNVSANSILFSTLKCFRTTTSYFAHQKPKKIPNKISLLYK